jgi:hypothetical protein
VLLSNSSSFSGLITIVSECSSCGELFSNQSNFAFSSFGISVLCDSKSVAPIFLRSSLLAIFNLLASNLRSFHLPHSGLGETYFLAVSKSFVKDIGCHGSTSNHVKSLSHLSAPRTKPLFASIILADSFQVQ